MNPISWVRSEANRQSVMEPEFKAGWSGNRLWLWKPVPGWKGHDGQSEEFVLCTKCNGWRATGEALRLPDSFPEI